MSVDPALLRKAFERLDFDATGRLQRDELVLAFSELGMPSDEASIEDLFNQADTAKVRSDLL